MNCKNCGGVNPPAAKVCQFCGSELEEKEKVYIPVHDSSPFASYQRSPMEAESSKAMAMAIVSLFLGFVIIRIVLSVIALSTVNRVEKEARLARVAAPSTVRTTRIICAVSLVLAGICAVYLFIAVIANAVYATTPSSTFY